MEFKHGISEGIAGGVRDVRFSEETPGRICEASLEELNKILGI